MKGCYAAAPIVKDGVVVESTNVEVFESFDAMGLKEELLVSIRLARPSPKRVTERL